MKAIIDSDIPVEFWTKGELLLEEEYSILESGDEYPFCSELSERTTINIDREQYGEIYVAGLAGDYCVYHTLKDLIESKCFDADILVVIGTSFNVYPAASLVGYTDEDIPVYYIDPNPACTPDYPDIKVIKATATRGMEELIKILNDNQ